MHRHHDLEGLELVHREKHLKLDAVEGSLSRVMLVVSARRVY